MGYPNSTLTAEYVRSLFYYNPKSGRTIWKRRKDAKKGWNLKHAGRRVGYVHTNGQGKRYWITSIDNRKQAVHRLIFVWMTGRWPTHDVDHIDGDGTNNRWANLREATRSENLRNSKIRRTNRSGFKGVSINNGRWRARIFYDGEEHVLGYFGDPATAHEAYKTAAIERFGEFARLA